MSFCFSEQGEVVESWQLWTQCCTTYIFLSAEWLNSFSKENTCFLNVFLTFAACKLLYDMPAPDIENVAYTNVCRQPIVTAKLPLDMFRQKEDMMRGLRFNVIGCFKDKCLSKPVLENTIKRMGGKVLSNTSADLLRMKHSSALHCYLVVDNQQSLNSAIKFVLSAVPMKATKKTTTRTFSLNYLSKNQMLICSSSCCQRSNVELVWMARSPQHSCQMSFFP